MLEKEVVLDFEEPRQDNTGTIITAAIIIVIGIWYWRRRKQRTLHNR